MRRTTKPEPNLEPVPADDVPLGAVFSEEAVPLAELRRELNLTQCELAERLNVVQSAIARYERNANPKVGTLRTVVESLGGELEVVVRLPGRRPARLELDVEDRPNSRPPPARPRPSRRKHRAAESGAVAAVPAG